MLAILSTERQLIGYFVRLLTLDDGTSAAGVEKCTDPYFDPYGDISEWTKHHGMDL